MQTKKAFLRIVAAFVLSTFFVTQAWAIWGFIPSAARFLMSTFIAAAPVVVFDEVTKTAQIQGTSGKSIRVNMAASAALHLAPLLLYLGYEAISGSGQCRAGGITQDITCEQYMADRPSVTWTQDDPNFRGWTASSTYGYIYDPNTGTTIPAEQVMWLDMTTNPTQAKTDNLVAGLKDLAVNNPTDFDQVVDMLDTMTLFKGGFSGANGEPNTVSSDGNGTVQVNGVNVTSNPVTDSGGTSHEILLDENGHPTIDGIPATDLGDPTAPSGGTATTSGDIGAVVQAVNAHKAQNSIDSARLKSAIDGTTAAVNAASSASQSDNADLLAAQQETTAAIEGESAQSALDAIAAERAKFGTAGNAGDANFLDQQDTLIRDALPIDGMLNALTATNFLDKVPASDGSQCMALDLDVFGNGRTIHLDPCPVIEVTLPFLNYAFLAVFAIMGILPWFRPNAVTA